jgi:hypothetical protein
MTREYDVERLKSKGEHFMYPSHIPMNYHFPNTPFQEVNYFHAIPGDRQFGGFPPPLAPPGQGPDAGAPTRVLDLKTRILTHLF